MNPKQILVVDDEMDTELLLNQKFKKQIQSGEYVITYATTPELALSFMEKKFIYDLILTDMNFGITSRMSGIEFVKKLKSLNIKSQIIALSAFLGMPEIRAVMNAGAFDFIIKPIDFNDLEITFERALKETESLTIKPNQKIIIWRYHYESNSKRKEENQKREENIDTNWFTNKSLQDTIELLIHKGKRIDQVIITDRFGGMAGGGVQEAIILVS